MEKARRFKLFIEGLKAAAPVSSADAALTLIAKTLNGIEDEHSGVPFAPEKWFSDGRMYPPQNDSARSRGAGVTEYRSFAHSTFIAKNGAFLILRRRDERVEISKPGADGKTLQPPV